ncbi:hypothetical protein QII79_gp1 [ssRNA phage Gephyllon.3_2]|uniref:Uncharacterized protein n=2 Tax=Norzivirales TaxID=2842247 RepID=A0A8S5L364_9VIRU|nr:hypothetical protein QII79_gp1 [ssRNA phage Gephyllon.3_2]QDH89890.1 MAG: hypothetical protein H3BulkLitter16284_000004 [Leviviridae sp.]DAD52222.1 TPA_asm: hypothetical protein [ssRNA phage Gephyllon.3_2]
MTLKTQIIRDGVSNDSFDSLSDYLSFEITSISKDMRRVVVRLFVDDHLHACSPGIEVSVNDIDRFVNSWQALWSCRV